MPFKDKEYAKNYWREYARKWRIKNRKYYLQVRKKHYEKNRKKILNQQKIWQDKNRELTAEKNRKIRLEVLIHYSGNPPHCQCPNCNEIRLEFLTIDHIKGGGHRLRGKQGYLPRWLKTHNFPKDYQVLCFNCNSAKGIYGACPHTKQ